MVTMSKPWPHPKTGTYHVRRAFPDDVKSVLGWEYKVSLGTKSASEAKRRLLPHLMRFDRLVETARSPSYVSDERAKALAGEWLRGELERDRQAREVGPVEVEQDFPEAIEPYDLELEKLEEAERRGRHLDEVNDTATDMLRSHGLVVETEQGSWDRVRREMFWAKVELLKALQARSSGDVVRSTELLEQFPDYEPPARVVAPKRSGGKGERLSALLDVWKAEQSPGPTTIMEVERAVRRFTELHGDIPAVAIDKRMVREYRDALKQLPNPLSGSLSKMPMAELLADVRDNPPQRTMTRGNLKKYLGSISAVLSAAGRAGRFDAIDPNWSNPALDVPVQALGNDDVEREPYEAADLRAIFHSPVFVEGLRPKAGGGEAAYWLPLLALFTGARQGELAQLHVTDVREVRDEGVWLIDINRKGGKRVKNDPSVRRAPLHRELLRCGFLDYVQAMRSSGAERLFPDLKPDSAGRAAGNWSKWWRRYTNGLGIDDPAKVFHSFRHTFITEARRSGVSRSDYMAICGHSSGDVSDDYGNVPIEQLARAMETFRVKGLDLSHLRVEG